ncbi:hypothetical protein DESPIGER_1384 [Desulfovibrio piger]|uniref:Uncharacterized protein n=1 Tax=Desulfovibrio piger TaxID=901 RepID=A0A1K1LIA7_9BACT|nr:hypothetical protein DESPIGER_1384 [Desulfovibrio piger]
MRTVMAGTSGTRDRRPEQARQDRSGPGRTGPAGGGEEEARRMEP